MGSIPAHAGEPLVESSATTTGGVYPRPRGGTVGGQVGGENGKGLSPPTRGNRRRGRRCPNRPRSIPAHAGEPSGRGSRITARAVYPRPRGGTAELLEKAAIEWGLSPPTRGNHIEIKEAERSRRSIPAHAGEPSASRKICAVVEVYPRPRGGTRPAIQNSRVRRGLSPPTRGNRLPIPRSPRLARSIPAHAGEPQSDDHFSPSL